MTAQFQRFLPYEKGKENWPTSARAFWEARLSPRCGVYNKC